MPVKIRLQLRGKKKQKHYFIVVADTRSPRNGKIIEKLGYYKTYTTPSTFDIDIDRSLYWLFNGAQLTNTVRSILKKSGVLYKKHLLGGVKKGSFTESEAKNKYDEWFNQKQIKVHEAQKAWNKQKTLDVLIKQGVIPHFKEKKKEFAKNNKVPRSLSISNSGEGKYIQDKFYQRVILKEYIEIKFNDVMNNIHNCTLGIELRLNNDAGNILRVGQEYKLDIVLSIYNSHYDREISNQIKVLMNPHNMEIVDRSIKKVYFNRRYVGCSHFRFKPTNIDSNKFEVEFIQNLNTIKSIPLEFQVVE